MERDEDNARQTVFDTQREKQFTMEYMEVFHRLAAAEKISVVAVIHLAAPCRTFNMIRVL